MTRFSARFDMSILQKYNLPRLLSVVGVLLFLYLQYLLWFGHGGYFQHQKIQQVIQAQEAHNDELKERNRILKAEVHDLKGGNMAVEEHARLDLGLIKPGETFIQMSTITE